MSRIGIYYTACFLETQTVAPTIYGFQGINRCIQYLNSQPNKAFFYTSNSYDVSNAIILTQGGNQFEDYTAHNFLELYQDADHDIILNRRR